MTLINSLTLGGYVGFDCDFSTGSLRDAISGNVCTISGGAPSFRSGKSRDIYFPATADRLQLASTTANRLNGGALTLVAYFPNKITKQNSVSRIMTKQDGASNGWDWFIGGVPPFGSMTLVINDGTGNRVLAPASIVGRSCLITTMVTGAAPQFYADGTFIGAASSNAVALPASTSVITIGNYYGGGGHLQNGIGRVMGISRALTPSEVATMYEELSAPRSAGKSKCYGFISSPTPTPPTYYGKELLVDGDMEASGVTSWTTNGLGVTRTKQTAFATGTQCLRVATTNILTGCKNSITLTAGKKYRLQGYARSDGTGIPCILLGTAGVPGTFWQGVASASTQRIDTDLLCSTGAAFDFFPSNNTAAASYVEFDDLSLREVGGAANLALHWMLDKTIPGTNTIADLSGNNRVGTATNIGGSKGLITQQAVSMNGKATSFILRTGAITECIPSNNQHSWSIWFRSTTKCFLFADAGTNYYCIAQVNQIIFSIGGAGVSITCAPLDGKWHHVYFEKNGTAGNGYYDNVKTTFAAASFGNVPATGSIQIGGWAVGDPAAGLNGNIQDFRLYTQNLSSTERTNLYLEGAKRLTFNLPMRQETEVTLADVTAVGSMVGNTPFKVRDAGGTWRITEPKPGKKYIIDAGGAYVGAGIETTQAFGTWVFEYYHPPGASTEGGVFSFVSNGQNVASATRNVWAVQPFGTNLAVAWFGPTLTYSYKIQNTTFLTRDTYYTIAITRNNLGVITLYVKGGPTAPNWILMPTDVGQNPSVADLTYPTSSMLQLASNKASSNCGYGAIHMHEGVLSLDQIKALYP